MAKTVLDLINDAAMKVTGDPYRFDETNQITYDNGLRNLNFVFDQVMLYRDWSFLRERTTTRPEASLDIDDQWTIVKVSDEHGRPWRVNRNAEDLRTREYCVVADRLITGRGSQVDETVFVDYTPVPREFTKPDQKIPDKLYNILVLMTAYEMSRFDAASDDTLLSQAQQRMAELANADMANSGEEVLY